MLAAQRAERARGRAARAAPDDRQRARLPVALGRHERIDADRQHAAAVLEVDAQLLAARDQVAAVVDLAVEHRVHEAADRRLAGPLGRAGALHLERQQRRHHAQHRGLGHVVSRTRKRSWPTTASDTRRSIAVTPSFLESSSRSSAGEAAATASTAPRASISATVAASAAAAQRAVSGRPAPDSTASASASSAAADPSGAAVCSVFCACFGHLSGGQCRREVAYRNGCSTAWIPKKSRIWSQ